MIVRSFSLLIGVESVVASPVDDDMCCVGSIFSAAEVCVTVTIDLDCSANSNGLHFINVFVHVVFALECIWATNEQVHPAGATPTWLSLRGITSDADEMTPYERYRRFK